MKERAPAWVVAVALVALLLGAWFRLSHLNTKYYSDDEMYSSLYVAGYSMHDLFAYAPKDVVSVGDFVRTFQAPASGRTALDTVRVLADWDPEHPPLYYLLERGVEETFGDSAAARRVLAAVIGLLLLPAVFWLCTELFGFSAAGWIAVALLAVSPFQLVYSQKVREYTLFELCTIVSAALLVRASRASKNPYLWLAYGVALALTLYSALFSLFVLLAFVAFALLRSRRDRDGRMLLPFAVSTGAAFAAFVPWLLALRSNWQYASHTNGWFAIPLPLKLYAAKVIFGITSVFFDAEYLHVSLAVLLVPVCLAAAYALWLFVRRAPFEGKVLLLCLAGTTALAILCTDVFLHASRATQQRYLIVALLAGEIAVAYGCAAALAARPGQRGLNWVAPVLVGVLVAAGAFSCWIGESQRSWWANSEAAPFAAAASYVEKTPSAVVLTNPYWGVQFANVANPRDQLTFEPASALHSGAQLYLLSPDPQQLASVRAGKRMPGELVDLSTQESGTVQNIHMAVAQAHNRSAASLTILWQFGPR